MTTFAQTCPYLFGFVCFGLGTIAGFIVYTFIGGCWRGDWITELPPTETESLADTIKRIEEGG